jgi:hypothetical protein
LHLFVRSPLFRVMDEMGAVVDARAGLRAALTVRRASPPQALVYQIEGLQ